MAVDTTERAPVRAVPVASGRPSLDDNVARASLREAGEIAAFGLRSVAALTSAPRYAAEVLRQAAILVRGSTLIIASMTFLIAVSVINFAFYILRALAATDYTGLVSGIIIPRGTTVLMFGYIFAAKVGCGMVSEIGAMSINQETAAYEAEGVDPIRYVVGTRLAGALLFLPVVVPVALVAGTAGGYFSGILVLHGLSASAFWRYHWGVQAVNDQLLAFLCMGVQAVVIVIVSCFYGLRARGGPASVGSASARSLVVNLVLIHLIVPGYLALFYGTNAHLPIGG
jgi:phospholipid/cholesterol/gamma-HCH transport system permease protein